MSNILQFSIKLNDLMSGALGKLAGSSAKHLGQVKSDLLGAQSATNGLKLAAKGAATSINDLRSSIDRLRNTRDLIHPSNTAQIRVLNSEIHKMERQLNRLQTMNGSRLKTWGRDALNQMPGAGLISNPLVMLGTGAYMAGKLAMDADRTRTGVQVLAGDKVGGQLYNQLTKYANDTIFGNELHQNAQTMLGFGIAADKIMPSMKMLGDVSMGNKEKLGSLTLAFSQVASAGRLTGQDLLQFVNAGFNPLGIIAEKTGASMADLKKKMEDGGISAAMVEEAFRVATSAGGRFYNMTQKMAETPYGKLQAFLGSLQTFGVKMGQLVLPVLSKVLSVLSGLIDFLNKYGAETVGILGAIGAGFLYANTGAVAAAIGFRGAAMASWLLNSGLAKMIALLAANPIALAVGAGIAALGYYMKKTADRTAELREQTEKLTAIRSDALQVQTEEKTRLTSLLDVYKDANKPLAEREAALKKLRETMGDYAKDLRTEADWNKRGAEAIALYTNRLYNQAVARGMQKRIEELSAQRAAEMSKADSDYNPGIGANMFYRMNALGNALMQADFRPGAGGAFMSRQQANYEKSVAGHRSRAKSNAVGDIDSQLNKMKGYLGGFSQYLSPGDVATDPLGGLGADSKGKGGKSMAESITGGGPRVININGVKFADTVQIHGGGGKSANENAEEYFHDMFLRLLNSGARMAG